MKKNERSIYTSKGILSNIPNMTFVSNITGVIIATRVESNGLRTIGIRSVSTACQYSTGHLRKECKKKGLKIYEDNYVDMGALTILLSKARSDKPLKLPVLEECRQFVIGRACR